MEKSDNFITIQNFMRTELNLKGNDLLVYAIIYGFSQDGESRYTGSLQYIADWCGATRQGIIKSINHLIELNLIYKIEINSKRFAYIAIRNIVNSVNINDENDNVNSVNINVNSVTENVNSVNIKSKLSLQNNIDNIDNNIAYYSNNTEVEESTTPKKYKKYLKYIEQKLLEYDFSDTVVDKLIMYYEDRIDKHDIPGKNQVESQLNRLAIVNEQLQIKTIEDAINGGWKNLTCTLDNISTNTPSYHISEYGDTSNNKEQLNVSDLTHVF